MLLFFIVFTVLYCLCQSVKGLPEQVIIVTFCLLIWLELKRVHRTFKTAPCTDCESEPTVTHTDINHSSYAVFLSCLLNRFNVCWRVEHRNTLKENPVKSEIQQLCVLFHWIYSSGMWSFTKKMNSRAKVWHFYFHCCPVITKIVYKNMSVYQLCFKYCCWNWSN